MRKSLTLAAAGGLLLLSAVHSNAADGDAGTVMIVSHACTEQPIKNQRDFDAVVAKAKGDAVEGFALTLLACPVIVLPADEAHRSNGAAGPAVDFDITVTDSNGDKQTLADATFTSAKLCETDFDRDVNGDGTKAADVCLDTSYYALNNLAVGEVTVQETTHPNGWKFGTRLLDPKTLQPAGSDDSKAGADFNAKHATVTLDLAADPDNGAMLHVYNFADSPATDTLPTGTVGSQVPMLTIVTGLLVTLIGGAYALRRRSV